MTLWMSQKISDNDSDFNKVSENVSEDVSEDLNVSSLGRTCLPMPADSPGCGAPMRALMAGLGCSGNRLAPPPTEIRNIITVVI